jgi:hypothetical protein
MTVLISTNLNSWRIGIRNESPKYILKIYIGTPEAYLIAPGDSAERRHNSNIRKQLR